MVRQGSHFTLPATSLGVPALLLALLTAQAVALGLNSPTSRRLSSADGNNQVTSFCKVYNSNLTCTSCIRDYYLQNNACVAVPSASRIEGCNVYGSANTCAVCDNGRFLANNNGACQNATGGSNCLAYLNNTACLSCQPGFALSNAACVQIPFCAQSNGSVCTACNSGYYLGSDGTCQQLTTGNSIANCGAYLADGSCARCATGFIANVNGTSCIAASQLDNEIDPLCVDQRVQNGTVCSLCRQGFSLQNGQCVLVSTSESCLVFDPDNQNNCMVCMSGYSMLALTGGCQLNAAVNTGIVDPVGGAASVYFWKVVLLVVMGVHFG